MIKINDLNNGFSVVELLIVFAVLIVIGVSGYFVFSRNTNEITKQTCFPGNNLCYQVPINWQVTYTPASDLIPATQEITSSNTTKESDPICPAGPSANACSMNEVPDAVIDIYQIPSSGAATVQAFVAEEYIASGVSPGALYLTSFGGQPAECRASSGNSIANLPPSIPLGMLYGGCDTLWKNYDY